MTATAIRPPADYWSLGRATSEQQIIAERLAVKSAELRRLLSLNMTAPIRERAKTLRRELRALCVQMRGAGL